MTSHNRIRLRSILINVAVIALVLMCIAVAILTIMPTQLHSPAESTANVQRILAELPDARARWEKQSISDYDIDATMSIALSCAALPETPPTTFHVRDGKVQTAGFSNCEKELVKLLPPAGYAGLENTLEQIDADKYFLDVQFDKEYGFISKYDFECNDTSVSDCFAHFEISNLRRVNP